jgi:ribosomal protein S18 acetylase RimI-like enzyme
LNNFKIRKFNLKDIDAVCKFSKNKDDIFFSFPQISYPLSKKKILQLIEKRPESYVLTLKSIVIGFANFFNLIKMEECFIGNVLIHSEYRGKGAGKYMMKKMIEIAWRKLKVKVVKITCFNNNYNALALYTNLNFVPYKIVFKKFNNIKKAIIKMKLEINK